ncbi:MAG: 3-oxoacyl-[acyl-carrier-protein] synthase [Bacillota bacterium]|jgi:3-oxoacyl-[acyl-carrier-protein] synthase-3|nr:3-oxoacyl-[acyl-carrier-protein] synthase [Bacillota bacterium]
MRTLTGSFHAYIVPAITSVGSAVPARTVTNKDLEAALATTDDWIRQRTGIERRHLASTEDKTGALAANAAQAALNASRLTAEELDAIIVATSTPDDAIVPTACQVQAALGASRAFAFDLAAACSGFVYACAMAGQWIKSGQVQHALVIGSETFSRLVNWSDRQTAILFGDGAGAVVLSAVPSSRDDWYCHLGADGSGKDLLFAPRGSYLQMKGREVFKFGVRVVTEELERLAAQSGLRLEEIDLFVLHQANQRIIEAVAQRLNLPPERLFSNIAHYGNTSAASIPIALAEAAQKGLLSPGSRVALVGFGAGLTWATCLLTYRPPGTE